MASAASDSASATVDSKQLVAALELPQDRWTGQGQDRAELVLLQWLTECEKAVEKLPQVSSGAGGVSDKATWDARAHDRTAQHSTWLASNEGRLTLQHKVCVCSKSCRARGRRVAGSAIKC